jgi:hypothetical protein
VDLQGREMGGKIVRPLSAKPKLTGVCQYSGISCIYDPHILIQVLEDDCTLIERSWRIELVEL